MILQQKMMILPLKSITFVTGDASAQHPPEVEARLRLSMEFVFDFKRPGIHSKQNKHRGRTHYFMFN